MLKSFIKDYLILFHIYDDISLFLSLFDIPMSVNDFFKRIGSINHHF